MSATMAIVAGLLGAFGGSQKDKSRTRQTSDFFPTSSFLPAEGFEFLGGSTMPSTDPLERERRRGLFTSAITRDLEAAAEGLPPEVLQRILAQIATGFQGAGEQAGRTAALGFGSAALSPAQVEASRAIAAANAQANFAQQSQAVRADRLDAIRNFFAQIQGIRFGAPSQIVRTEKSGGGTKGGIQGFAGGLTSGAGGGGGFGGGGGGGSIS